MRVDYLNYGSLNVSSLPSTRSVKQVIVGKHLIERSVDDDGRQAAHKTLLVFVLEEEVFGERRGSFDLKEG
jgi:hypothetical protein